MKTLAAVALIAVAAAPATSFRPGLWEIRNVPGQATLDGKPLEDLPLGAPHADRVCMTAADAAQPAKWLARDNGKCTIVRSSLTVSKVAIAGTCPPPSEDAGVGAFTQTGHWTPTSFLVRFTSTVTGDNGRMGFGGTMSGRRIGDCS